MLMIVESINSHWIPIKFITV